LEDLDSALQHKIKDEWIVTINDEQVPIIDISLTLFNEFNRTGQFSDDKKNIQLPFIALVRNPVVEKGTLFDTHYNIPSHPTFSVYREKKLIGGKPHIVSHKIPQPTNVDIKYTVSYLCTRQRDLNKLNQKVLKFFEHSQYYISVKGQYMPIYLDSISDTSQKELESRKFFKQDYSLTLKGYIMCEEDFEKTIMADNVKLNLQIEQDKSPDEIFSCTKGKCSKHSCPICYNFNFGRKPKNFCKVMVTEDILFMSANQKEDAEYTITLNGTDVTIPFQAKKGDSLFVKHNICSKKGIFIKLCGHRLNPDED